MNYSQLYEVILNWGQPYGQLKLWLATSCVANTFQLVKATWSQSLTLQIKVDVNQSYFAESDSSLKINMYDETACEQLSANSYQ